MRRLHDRPTGGTATPDTAPDYRIEISEMNGNMSAKKKVRTAALQWPDSRTADRLQEGKPRFHRDPESPGMLKSSTGTANGFPPDVDGSMEEVRR